MNSPRTMRRIERPLVGLLTAYVLALQAILAGVAASHMAGLPGDAFTICTQTGAAGSGDPQHAGHSPLCVLCTVAAASAATLPGSPASPDIGRAASVIAWTMPAAVALPALHTPRSSQGPPGFA